MSDEAAFMGTINEQHYTQLLAGEPLSDGERLVYADWLDEHGNPLGEFIRVQCELAKMPPEYRQLCVVDGAGTMMEGLGVAAISEGDGYYSVSYLESGLSIDRFDAGERIDLYADLPGKGLRWLRGLKFVKDIPERSEFIFRRDDQSGPWAGHELRRRDRGLLIAADVSTWVLGAWESVNHAPLKLGARNSLEVEVRFDGKYVGMRFRRGFPSIIKTTLADWVGFHAAGGFGQKGYGPLIVDRVPVERVRFTDRVPQKNGDLGFFWTNGSSQQLNCIPSFILNLIAVKDDSPTWFDYYKTAEDAHSALSLAAIRWAWERCELYRRIMGVASR